MTTSKEKTAYQEDPGAAEAFWDRHYRQHGRFWSGTPNLIMSTIASTLSPGRSLDLGCSNGGDAIWLALHGWQATGVDVAPAAVELAHQSARDAGVADRAQFEQHDLSISMPMGPFDLISASFFHTPVEMDRTAIFRRAAERLTPGGVLLIVDHGSIAPWSWDQDPDHVFPEPSEIFAELRLDPHGWTPELLEDRDREAEGPNGVRATVRDTVVMVRRLG